MVVDDHQIWSEAVARDLTGAGFSVVATAADGAEALRRLPAVRPDVLVLDLHLPVMDGVAVTREVVSTLPGAMWLQGARSARRRHRRKRLAAPSRYSC